MTKKTIKKSTFRKKVKKDIQNQKDRRSGFGYLKLPQGVGVYKPKPSEGRGRAYIDILPYTITSKSHSDLDDDLKVGDMWYKSPFLVHNNIGVDNESVICLKTFGKKCPICEYRERIHSEGADKEDIKALNSKQRILYAVIPKNDKEFEEKVHLWDVSPYVFQDKLNDEIEENEEFADFPALEGGYTLKIRFTKEVFNGNVWADVGRIDFEEREEDYPESILKEVPELDTCFKELSYNKLEAMFLEDDLQVDERVDEEDLETDEAEETDEEGEETKPKRRRKKVVEPEPEEEEEEEEEEEKAKPERKKKVSGKKCPYGHRFGVDCDEEENEDDCDECDIWEECNKEMEENNE